MEAEAIPIVSFLTVAGGIMGAAIKAFVDTQRIGQANKKMENEYKKHESASFVDLFQNFMEELRKDRSDKKEEMHIQMTNMADLINQLKNERSAAGYWAECAASFQSDLAEIREKLARQEGQLKLCEEQNNIQDILNRNHFELMEKMNEIMPTKKEHLQ